MLPNSGLISFHQILTEMQFGIDTPMDLRLQKVNERKQVWIDGAWRNLNMCSPKTPKDTPPFNLMDWYEYDHTTKQDCCAFIEDFSDNSRGWYSANISSVVFNNGVVELSGLGVDEPRFGLNSVSPNPGISFNPRDYNYVVVRMRAATNTGGTQGIFFFGSPEIGGTFVSRPYAIGTTFADYIFDFSNTPDWISQGQIRNFALGLPNNGPNIFIESFRICNKEDLPVYTPVRIIGELFGPEVVGTGDDYQYNLSVRNTGATATTGTTTIKIFFNPTSGITYRTSSFSGWTYSFSAGVLTLTTTSVLQPGYFASLPILVTGTTVGTYQITGKVWTAGDPVASTEATARDTNSLQTIVTDNPPCNPLTSLQINGDSTVNQGSTNDYNISYSGSTRGITFTWSIVSGSNATIVSGQGTSAIRVSFNFANTSSQIILRCTITNLCSTVSADITVSPRLFGNTQQSRGFTSQSCAPGQVPGTWVLTVLENTYFGFDVNLANQLAINWLNSSAAQAQAEAEMAAAGVQCFASCNSITGVSVNIYLNGNQVSFDNVIFGQTYELRAFVTGGSNITYDWFFTHGNPVNQVGNSVFVQFNFNDRSVPSNGGVSYDNASFAVRVRNNCNASEATTGATITPQLTTLSDTRAYVRNNCPVGQEPVGSVTDTVSYSAVTFDRANEGLAIVVVNRQNLANTQLTCQSVNVGNDIQFGTFTRNNCPSNSIPVGSIQFQINANTYFAPTKDQANAIAIAELNAQGQAAANSQLVCQLLPVTGLTWSTSVIGNGVPGCESAGWVISPDRMRIRFNVADDSLECGGTCGALQSGTAIANISVGSSNTFLSLDFEGIGELESSAFDTIRFLLDGVELARGNAAGGGLGCQMGPIVKTILVPGPYLLMANTSYELKIEFSTVDGRFHLGSYYQVNLAFS